MLAIRVGLVASLLLVSLSLLPEIWPQAGNGVRHFIASVENTVRPVMERVAHRFGVDWGRSAIRFAEVDEPVDAAMSKENRPARTRADRRVETRARTEGSGPTGNGVGRAAANAQETITIYRGNRIEEIPKSARDGSRARAHRGRRSVSGRARAIDGDSLEVNGAEIRLHGIDAPEYRQPCRLRGHHWPCGREAKQALASEIRGKRVVCEVRDRDSYGRFVATCSIAGRSLNAWMVGQGWAFAYRRYSRAYIDEEAQARAARRGIWSGEVVEPWKWRKGQRR